MPKPSKPEQVIHPDMVDKMRPSYCILKWDADEMKWVVCCYCMREDEVLKRWTNLQREFPGQKFQTFVSLSASRSEDVKKNVSALLKRMRKNGKSN